MAPTIGTVTSGTYDISILPVYGSTIQNSYSNIYTYNGASIYTLLKDFEFSLNPLK
ncbi:MAG: hypothetical protein ACK5HL_04680 [Bacilli bacterium]